LHHAPVDLPISEQGRVVRELLAAGHDPKATDDDGWTPLHAAAEHFAVDVAQILIDAGASVEAKDRFGNTPLHRAVFSSRGSGEMIQLLRKNGASATASNETGVTPLKLALQIANYDVAQWFKDVA